MTIKQITEDSIKNAIKRSKSNSFYKNPMDEIRDMKTKLAKETSKGKVDKKLLKAIETETLESFMSIENLSGSLSKRSNNYFLYRNALLASSTIINAFGVTGEHVIGADGFVDEENYSVGIGRKERSDVDKEIIDKETKFLTEFIDHFGLLEKAFEKTIGMIRDGDYFIEVVDLNSTTIDIDKNSKLKMLTEDTNSKSTRDDNVLDGLIKPLIYDRNEKSEEDLLIEKFLQEDQVFDSSEKDNEYKLHDYLLKKIQPENVIILELSDTLIGYLVIRLSDKIIKGQDQHIYQEEKRVLAERFNEYLLANINIKPEYLKLIKKSINEKKEIKKLFSLVISEQRATVEVRFVPPRQMAHFKNRNITEPESPYGESDLVGLVDDIRNLKNLKNDIIGNLRFNLTDRERITVDIDTEGDVSGTVDSVISSFKKKDAKAIETINSDSFDSEYVPAERFYIPRIGGKTPIEFETIPAPENKTTLDELEPLESNILNGMRVPSAFLDSKNSSYVTSLTQESNSYAAKIKTLQISITNADFKLAEFVYYQLFSEKLSGAVKFKLRPPIALMLSSLEEKLNSARTTIDFIYEVYVGDGTEEATVKMDKSGIAKHILPEMDWKYYDTLVEEIVEEEEDEPTDEK